MKNKKIIVGAVLLIAIVLLGVGFASISNIILNVSGEAQSTPNQENFKVKFISTEVSDTEKVTATITDDITATLNVEGLTAAGDEVTATYSIKNESTDLLANLSAELTFDNKEYFNVTHTFEKTSIASQETTTVTITVALIKTPIIENQTSNVTLKLTAAPANPTN